MNDRGRKKILAKTYASSHAVMHVVLRLSPRMHCASTALRQHRFWPHRRMSVPWRAISLAIGASTQSVGGSPQLLVAVRLMYASDMAQAPVATSARPDDLAALARANFAAPALRPLTPTSRATNITKEGRKKVGFLNDSWHSHIGIQMNNDGIIKLLSF